MQNQHIQPQIAQNQSFMRLVRTGGIPETTLQNSTPSLKLLLKQNIIETQRAMFPGYKYNEELRELWRELVSYFVGEYQDFNPSKGILVIGAIGCGKTTIFQILKTALGKHQEKFNSVGTWTLADEYQSVGMKFIAKYLFNEEILRVYNKETPINLFIDDLGSEAIVSHSYGDKRNVASLKTT